jgi:hypothetical protein
MFISISISIFLYIFIYKIYYNMISIKFEDLTTTDIEESVLWHNMKKCDDICNLQLFISCSMGWLRLNPTKNMQDLESELRKRDFNTHLYAKDVPEDFQHTLELNSKICNYECFFSCRPKKLALEEVLEFHGTYENNFEKLANSGFRCLKSEKDNLDDLDKKKDLKVFDDKDKSISRLLTECKKKITIVSISAEKYIRDICQFCKEKYGEEPEHRIIGISHNGGPIMGLFLGNELVNEYGYIIECSGYGETIEKHMRLHKLR